MRGERRRSFRARKRGKSRGGNCVWEASGIPRDEEKGGAFVLSPKEVGRKAHTHASFSLSLSISSGWLRPNTWVGGRIWKRNSSSKARNLSLAFPLDARASARIGIERRAARAKSCSPRMRRRRAARGEERFLPPPPSRYGIHPAFIPLSFSPPFFFVAVASSLVDTSTSAICFPSSLIPSLSSQLRRRRTSGAAPLDVHGRYARTSFARKPFARRRCEGAFSLPPYPADSRFHSFH